MKIKRDYYINDRSGIECFVVYTYFSIVAYRFEHKSNVEHIMHHKTFARNWSPSKYHKFVSLNELGGDNK